MPSRHIGPLDRNDAPAPAWALPLPHAGSCSVHNPSRRRRASTRLSTVRMAKSQRAWVGSIMVSRRTFALACRCHPAGPQIHPPSKSTKHRPGVPLGLATLLGLVCRARTSIASCFRCDTCYLSCGALHLRQSIHAGASGYGHLASSSDGLPPLAHQRYQDSHAHGRYPPVERDRTGRQEASPQRGYPLDDRGPARWTTRHPRSGVAAWAMRLAGLTESCCWI